jgi:hypothetical protein
MASMQHAASTPELSHLPFIYVGLPCFQKPNAISACRLHSRHICTVDVGRDASAINGRGASASAWSGRGASAINGRGASAINGRGASAWSGRGASAINGRGASAINGRASAWSGRVEVAHVRNAADSLRSPGMISRGLTGELAPFTRLGTIRGPSSAFEYHPSCRWSLDLCQYSSFMSLT